ncbi:MAG: hypothetical protein KIT81_10230 [Alphaproteobacteria bacterium]|nr:hypothetical protein [Alphaproteobacteria bacterium]
MKALAGIVWDPALPLWLIGGLGALGALLVLFALFRRARGAIARGAFLALGILALLNPSLVEEERQPLGDVAVAVIDESPSMNIGERRARAAAAEAHLRERVSRLANIELRVVRAGGPREGEEDPADEGTRLFQAVEQALFDTPRERVAGVILVTDGQVHDAPAAEAAERLGGPLHALIVGERNERDRRLILEQAPSYGIVGQPQQLTIRVEDPGAAGQPVTVSVRVDNGETRRIQMQVGVSRVVQFDLSHAGPTIVEMEAEPGQNELTLLNNRAAVVVNGVRDRLRVLLISGEPHAGERTWRNLLKADAAVDLVHFTILRPPEKQDGTPIRELSLIAFPIRELFEIKLDEFHLIIFDRYRRRGVLPNAYFENIARYVARGGALLEASGPAYATPLSLARTALIDVLPGKPTGLTIVEGFKPQVTEMGRRHPVSSGLPGDAADDPLWGRWFRQVEVQAGGGQTLLSGYGERPLLILDRVGEGRVAQILSDHFWLWARGFEGGGPHQELLRRVSHWLMKEPELDEDNLSGRARGNRLEITRRSLEPDESPVQVTKPGGQTEEVAMRETGAGHALGSLRVSEPGIYRMTDGRRTALAAVGAVNPKEYADMRATEDLLAPGVQATGGGMRWLAEAMPDIRRVAAGRDAAGRGWLGLRQHDAYTVTGVTQIPLLPALLVLILLLGALLWAWRREGA